LQFETNLISIHVTLGVGSGVQLLGVTSPWGLGRGIHAADTPATGPTPPSTDSGASSFGCWWVSTLVDTVDPRHAWMNLCQASKKRMESDPFFNEKGL
ncbi:hypothetical protein, partial [Stenotrophomonas sp. 2694]|uniref:hypothetical protein n=1 Tax=Stenotrophomonas sp. 2694 TaxID=3156317 RepID=UPI00339A9702